MKDINTYWEEITPERAHELLVKNTNNRKVRRMRISRIAKDIANGNFVTTHQGIGVAKDGTLLDGQHRLLGIIEAGQPVWMLVTEGLDHQVQRHMDRGAGRLVSDFLGGKSRVMKASALRYLLATNVLDGKVTVGDLETTTRNLITDADIYDYAEKNPGLIDDMEEIASLAQSASGYGPTGPTGLMVAAVTFPRVAEEALTKLRTGADMESGDPMLAFRNHRHSINRVALSVMVCLQTFDKIDRGRKVQRLTVNPDSRALTVPVR